MARIKSLLLALTLAVGLAGCGGAFIGYEYVDSDDHPPSVSLTASTSTARVGDLVRLAAAAADDWGVDHVDFYIVDGTGRGTFMTAVYREPYTIDAIVPDSADGRVHYLARAVDDSGQTRDSLVTITLVP